MPLTWSFRGVKVLGMDLVRKLESLGRAAQYDLCGACSSSGTGAHRQKSPLDRWIYPAALPDGRDIKLLKVLLTNDCDGECAYCVNRRSHDHRRVSFEPGELARLFMGMVDRGLVQGLFLSSGLSGNVIATQDRILAVLEILRRAHGFRGYAHVKVLPGAEMAQVERAVNLAQRVSVNLEAPGAERLSKISRNKSFPELYRRIEWIKRFQEAKGRRRTGQTTQFVVGASGESDREIAVLTEHLYRRMKLRRVYYSAFQPVENTPLENARGTPLIREHRLYQMDFLLRKYGFHVDELRFDGRENLPLESDPKTVWAQSHPEFFPVDVNLADRGALLRVPGLGPITVRRILKVRRGTKIRTLEDLKRLGAVGRRAAPYVLVDGRTPLESSGQMALFPPRGRA
jgi:predicted DNA-binding helix-hairpin-helix protein